MIGFVLAATWATYAAEAAVVAVPPAEIWWIESDAPRPTPSVARMKEMFRPVDGFEGRIENANHHENPLCQMKGLFRLNEPWRPGTALRFAHRTYRPRRIVLWRGSDGIALYHHPQFNNTGGWTAYRVRREDTSRPLPDAWVALAFDEGRWQQIGWGPELVMLDGKRLTLSRGGVWLLSVPWAGTPEEVYFELDGQVYCCEFTACPAAPPSPDPPEVVAAIDAPARLTWKVETAEGGEFAAEGGSIRLRASANKPGARAMAPLPLGTTGRMVCFQIENPQRATGLIVADDKGEELCRLAICGDQNKSERAVKLFNAGDNGSNTWIDMKSYPVPLVGQGRMWVAIVVGDRVAKVALSPDGIQWSTYSEVFNVRGSVPAQIGVYCVPHHNSDREITLHRIQVRRIPTAPGYAEVPFNRYVQSILDSSRPLGEKCGLIAAAAGMANGYDEWTRNVLVDAYNRLIEQALVEGNLRPFSNTWRLAASTAVAQRMLHRVSWTAALETEAISALYRFDWPHLRELALILRSWIGARRFFDDLSEEERPAARLADWIDVVLPRQYSLPQRLRSEGGYYRSPLMVTAGKEGFNAMTELVSMIEGKAFREACQAITGPIDPSALGLTPAPADSRLWCDYTVVIRTLIERHQPLRDMMRDEFSRLAALRLQTSVAAGDRQGLERTALQFIGTPAAVEARYRLGDQALSSGRFHEAMGHYRLAIRDSTDTKQRSAVAARMRLTAAMLGENFGTPVRETVRLGQIETAPDEFERIVERMRRRASERGSIASPDSSRWSRPSAHDLVASDLGRLDDRSAPPGGPLPSGMDWAARQLGLYVGRELLTASRSELVLWEIESGHRRWVQNLEPLANKSPWPMVAPCPAVTSEEIIFRRPARERPDVICVEASTGRVKWTIELHDGAASDPIAVGRELVVLAVQRVFPQKLIVRFCRIDLNTGQMIADRPIVEFLDLFNGELPCQAARIDDKIVASMNGAAVCCRLDGTVEWIRRQVSIPPRTADEQPRPWCVQKHHPPLKWGSFVAVFQPGMRSVEIVDLVNGQLIGYFVDPGIDQLVGIAGDRLIVKADDQLCALALPNAARGNDGPADDGNNDVAAPTTFPDEPMVLRPVWRHQMPQASEAVQCVEPDAVLYVSSVSDSQGKTEAAITLLAANDGRTLARKTVAGFPATKAVFGPLAASGEFLWVSASHTDKVQERSLWRIGAKSP